jgi:Tfp pilus assembly protein PilO
MSERAQIAVVAGVLLLVTVLGYFVLISPKRSTASDLKQQTAAVQTQIDQNRNSAFKQALPAVRAASVFSVAKAMPNQVEMPNVILQLSQLAGASGITFDQVTPGTAASTDVLLTPDTTDPFAAEPVQVTFTGTFYNMVAFLMRVRNLVRVENGKLEAQGRLFDVSDIEFCVVGTTASCSTSPPPNAPTGSAKSPVVHATLTINALVPQQPQLATSTVPGSTDTTSTTTGATTTSTTTTTSNPTSASPSTSGGTS